MPDQCKANCPDHTGQEERIKGVNGKLTLVIWLLGILIAAMMTCTGALYSSIQSMNVTLSAVGSRFAGIEAKITVIDAASQRLSDRVTEIERGRNGLLRNPN